jgi:hypothetical protein
MAGEVKVFASRVHSSEQCMVADENTSKHLRDFLAIFSVNLIYISTVYLV